MRKYDFDLIVIGGGSGGVRTARWSAGLGAKSAICEMSRYGGTCVIRGCIPKKLMLEASQLPAQLKYFSSVGWKTHQPCALDWKQQKLGRDKELSRLEEIYEKLLSEKKAEVLKGHGKIVDSHTVEVNGKSYTTQFIVIAVGSAPVMPEIPGIQWALTSDDVFEMPKLPSSILIMGTGYIGLEFAGIFNAFGSKTTIVSRRDLVLRGFDEDLRAFLQKEIIKTGVNIVTNDSVTEIIKHEDGGPELSLEVKGNKGSLGRFSAVLFAVGRTPKIKNLGLESAGVQVNSKNEIKVNKYFETSVKNIYALGDCADTPFQLTPVATAEGMHLAEYLCSQLNLDSQKPAVVKKGSAGGSMDYTYVPTAVFSQPPAAVVGLTEEQAIKEGYKVNIYKSSFRPLKYTVTTIDKKTFMKMIVDSQTDKVLGVHIVGDTAPEIMQGTAVALKAGAKKTDFDRTIGIHPTSAEELVTMRNKVR